MKRLIQSTALAWILASAFACAQNVVLPAHTRVTAQTAQVFRLGALKPGDTVTLLVRRPVRAGKTLVIPEGTPVRARIEAVQAEPMDFSVRVEPLRVGSVAVPLEGSVLPMKHGELAEEPAEWMPPELKYQFWQPPPYRGGWDGTDPKDMVRPGRVVELWTAADVSIPVSALPMERGGAYAGDPVIYVSDRLREKNGHILCGKSGVLGIHHPDPAVLRVQPRTYVFHTDRPGEVSATIDAERNHRYLVFHDRDGLDVVNVDGRTDLLDYLPKLSRPDDFYFDADSLTQADAAAVRRDLDAGGCGLIKTLHKPTSARPVPAPR